MAIYALEDAPALTRPRGNLLDVADVRDDGSLGWAQMDDIYESIACLDIGQEPVDPCTTVVANEVQTVTITGAPTGGTFTLTFQGQTTGAIARNATAAAVKAALVALSNVDSSDVIVTGTGPYSITFDGQYAGLNVTQMSATSSFTGGTAPTTTVTTGTQGVGGKTAVTPSVWVDGTRFAAYGILRCRAIGFGYDQAEEKARMAYDWAESRIVERNVMAKHFGTAGAKAQILTSGTAVELVNGIAMLEGFFGRFYSGVPVLHATSAMASIATQRNGVSRGTDGLLHTALGSFFVNGGGYMSTVSPTGVPSAANEGWLYATGPVVIRRGPLVSRRAFNEINNEVTGFAERQYLVTTDCLMAAVQVKTVFS